MLNENILSLAKIGSKRKLVFNRLAIFTKRDFLFYLPYKYLKLTNMLIEDYIAIKVTVIKKTKINAKYFCIIVENNGTKINLNFYNIKFYNIFYKGQTYYICGNLYIKEREYYMDSPYILNNSNNNIIPIYKGVSSYLFRSIVLPIINELDDIELIKGQYTIKKTFFNLHNGIDIEESLKVLKYLEASFLISLFQRRNIDKILKTSLEKVLKHIPYDLSEKQLMVCKKIEKTLKEGKELKYFVYGEVGAGKTIISIISMLMIVNMGYTTILLAPTVTLAYQHYEEIIKIKPNMKSEIMLLTSLSKTKKEIKENIKNNKYKIIIGTHSLMYLETITNLGLIIIDELHKFGVLQRSNLLDKAIIKNVLMLTATPIPRSLTLMINNLMDYDTLPSFNKKNIKTIWIKEDDVDIIYSKLREKKVYWIIPNIEENKRNNGIMHRFKNLSEKFENVYVLHGKMKDKEKLLIIDFFKKIRTGILVATTIIETGINIPDVEIIVIENSDNFGLSQLHQLRGRVGRMGQEAYCILISKYRTKKIEYMKKYDNGFEISQKDLEIRGAGKITGTLQHGCDAFYFLTEEDHEIFQEAKKDKKKFKAFEIFANSDISC